MYNIAVIVLVSDRSILLVHTVYLLKLKLFFIVVNAFTNANTKL